MKRIFLQALEDKSFVYQFIVWEGGAEARCRCLSPLQTLDRLPLTNPEHFGTPVIGKKGNRGRRSNPMWVSSSDSVHPAGLVSKLIYQGSVMPSRRDFLYISNRLPPSAEMKDLLSSPSPHKQPLRLGRGEPTRFLQLLNHVRLLCERAC